MHRTHIAITAGKLALAIAGLSLLAGCQTGPRMAGPVRAIWVTRFDYKTADDVNRIIENCDDAGFNTVVFQVRGNGTAFYRSQIEPWAEQFNFTDPGFDPLQVAVAKARERGVQLHAWVNVVPGWRGTKPPTDPNQVYNTHPEWFWYDQQGQRQPLTSFYVSLNPCLPEVRQYIVSVMKEIVANYDVDGIHMDYIRFPNEPPAIPAGSGIDYPRDARTLALYKEQTHLAPDENAEAWNRWRTEQVTQLVADIHDMMRANRPRAALTASVGSDPESSVRHFRDEKAWIQRKLIDAAFPMNYKSDLETFKTGLASWLPPSEDMPIVPGMWFASRIAPEAQPEVARQQIEYAIQTTGNVCVFSYASLFDSSDRDELAPARDGNAGDRAERQRQLREKRRQAILPLIATSPKS
jgi:uncharacterized lipoprotein YddW (UPF0748 family)